MRVAVEHVVRNNRGVLLLGVEEGAELPDEVWAHPLDGRRAVRPGQPERGQRVEVLEDVVQPAEPDRSVDLSLVVLGLGSETPRVSQDQVPDSKIKWS